MAWVKVIHLIGFAVWVGNMFACIEALNLHGKVEDGEKSKVDGSLKALAMAMDIGALLSIATGVIMIIKLKTLSMGGGWMHAKLTVVVLALLGTHGLIRAQIKRHRQGRGKAIPGFVRPVLTVTVIAIVALAVVRPF